MTWIEQNAFSNFGSYAIGGCKHELIVCLKMETLYFLTYIYSNMYIHIYSILCAYISIIFGLLSYKSMLSSILFLISHPK